MGFMDALKQTTVPIGPSDGFMPRTGVAQSPGLDLAGILSQIEPFIHKMRNRDLEDIRAQELMNPVRDPRMRNVMSPDSQPQNVVFNPGMTDFQKASLSMDRDKLATGTALEREKLETTKKFGQDKLDIQEGALKLNELKNEQIYNTKIKDMERKTEEANSRLQLAHDALTLKGNDANSMMAYRQAQLDAMNARHELDLAQRDANATETKRFHDAQIKDMQDKLDAAANVSVKTDVNDEGTSKTVTTTKGSKSSGTIRVKAPDGRTGSWPAGEALPKGYTKIEGTK